MASTTDHTHHHHNHAPFQAHLQQQQQVINQSLNSFNNHVIPAMDLDLDFSQMAYPGNVTAKPTWEMVLKTIFYVPVILLAIVGNVIVIVVVARNKRMRTTTNYYIVNLAVADCLVALTCSWPHLADDLTYFWPLGRFFCPFNTFLQVLFLVASIFTLTLIAGDRFFGIVFAMKAHFIERKASCTILAIWVLSTLVASPLIYYRRYDEIQWANTLEAWCDDQWPIEVSIDPVTGNYTSTSPGRKHYYLFVCVALFFLPCLVMSVAYLVIIVTLWSAQVPGERISKDIRTQTKMRKKIVMMLMVLLAVFVLCWSPLIVSLLYSELTWGSTLPPWYEDFNYVARFLAHANSMINPFIYAGFNDNFKKGFQNLYGGGERRTRYNTMVSRVDSFQSSTHITKV